jgi:hypothetical protein
MRSVAGISLTLAALCSAEAPLLPDHGARQGGIVADSAAGRQLFDDGGTVITAWRGSPRGILGDDFSL